MTKRRPRGQCCHKRLVGNTTFFCIEPYGHQCEHSHYVSIDDLERLCAEARRAALTEAAEAPGNPNSVQRATLLALRDREPR